MMRRFPYSPLLLVPVLAFAVAVLGCSGGATVTSGSSGGGGDPNTGGQAGSGEKKALDSTGWGTLKGKVTFAGDSPKPKDLKDRDDFKTHQDKAHCAMGDMNEQTWRIGENKGVANVVVFLRAPKGTFFKIPPQDKAGWSKEVVVDQPFCAFVPHVSVAFPSQFDPETKKSKPTGQVVKAANSAPIAHNTKYAGNTLTNVGANVTLQPKKDAVLTINPDDREPVRLNCDMHKWMTGYVFAFDHPFAAVSKGEGKDEDKQYGEFEIKAIPAGVELEVFYWHESNPKVMPAGKIKVEDGKTETLNIEIKK